MKRVLHLLDLPGPGGAEIIFVQLAARLRAHGFEPVAAVPSRGWTHDALAAEGVVPTVTPIKRGPFDARYLGQLIALIRRHRIDVVQSHLLGPSVYASLAALVCRVPVVCTFHGQMDLSPTERFSAAKFRLIRHAAHRVVFVSEALRRHFIAHTRLPPEKTVVVPNGIELPRDTAPRGDSFRRELGVEPGHFLVGAVGHLRPWKGYDTFLHAAAALVARSPDFRFVIVGRAEFGLEETLTELRDRLGLREFVTFAGFREDVGRVMESLDAYAITSSAEGFSLSTVQAMAHGVPVVATRCGGPEEILVDGVTGVLVEVGAAEQIADALWRLRSEPETRARLAGAARREVPGRFSLDAMIDSYARLYEEACARPAAAPREQPSPLTRHPA